MDSKASGSDLLELRREIDRIDAAMHGLLIERGEIIDRLIATKRTAETGSAFRPDREASMMRALAERHRGRLPPEAPEGIWRVIISTFTHLQAPFAVHVDAQADAAIRDSARFHFGFTVPCREAADVVAAVAASRGDVGLLPIGGTPAAWWRGLERPGAPKVIARLPFVERGGHPAGCPVLVIAPLEAEAGPAAVRLYSGRGDPGAAPDAAGCEAIAWAQGAWLLADASGRAPADARSALEAAGVEWGGAVGRYPPPYRPG